MLYPLSYGGARAQSSDPGIQLGWQGVVPVHPATRTPIFPAQDHSSGKRTSLSTGGLIGDLRWRGTPQSFIACGHVPAFIGSHSHSMPPARFAQRPRAGLRARASINGRP